MFRGGEKDKRTSKKGEGEWGPMSDSRSLIFTVGVIGVKDKE